MLNYYVSFFSFSKRQPSKLDFISFVREEKEKKYLPRDNFLLD